MGCIVWWSLEESLHRTSALNHSISHAPVSYLFNVLNTGLIWYPWIYENITLPGKPPSCHGDITLVGKPSCHGDITLLGKPPSCHGDITLVGKPSCHGDITLVGKPSSHGDITLVGKPPSCHGDITLLGKPPSCHGDITLLGKPPSCHDNALLNWDKCYLTQEYFQFRLIDFSLFELSILSFTVDNQSPVISCLCWRSLVLACLRDYPLGNPFPLT